MISTIHLKISQIKYQNLGKEMLNVLKLEKKENVEHQSIRQHLLKQHQLFELK